MDEQFASDRLEKTLNSIYNTTRRRMNWFLGRGKRNKSLEVLKEGLYEAYIHGREDTLMEEPKVQVDLDDPQPEGDFSGASEDLEFGGR